MSLRLMAGDATGTELVTAMCAAARTVGRMLQSPASDAAIAADHLRKCFGDVEAVKDVSFEIGAGRVLGLLGPNGAGKTTVVRMLATLARPDAGTARVLGVDVRRDPQAVRASIGLAGQYAAVDENLTGRENLQLVGRLTHLRAKAVERRADHLLEEFALADAGERVVRTYSGGMRRRLDLAAALVHEPPVIFLDEPTTGLDPQGRNDLWDVIEGLVAGGTTVLLTTQYLEEADRLADRIVVIDHGSVIAEGTAAELKARLGASVIEIAFRDDEEVARSVELLGEIGRVAREGGIVRVSVPGGAGASAMLETVRVLDAHRLNPSTMVLREPTLDDVFLHLTGHTTGDGESTDDESDGTAPGPRRRRSAS
jgi:ABC-2 type transport system ATP-binding protein